MREILITDRNIGKLGFRSFAATRILNDGQAVEFEYCSGFVYRVPKDYFLAWFPGPHGTQPTSSRATKEPHLKGSRRLPGSWLARVSLSNGDYYDTSWETVLMSCEPSYEHFGGLTPESKRMVKRFTLGTAKFRIEPPSRSAR